MERLVISANYLLFVDQFGRFWHLEFDQEAIPDGLMEHSRVFRVCGEGGDFKWF